MRMGMAYQSRARKRVRANAIPIRRAPDGSAFRKCESCGISVALALADMHHCHSPLPKNPTNKLIIQWPRSPFHFFMEEFVKTCSEGNLIEKDNKGCETWKNMSTKERQPFVDQAVKLDEAYARLLHDEENEIQRVDDEADSAEVGKCDERYEASTMNYYDSESSYWSLPVPNTMNKFC
ncbi:HMG1/2-like protein [Salvia miltiorrhiza]|uniref:HMG1/2-like protein n=1 Tax=Salvia miltiorrhiza TaxID=226208 RepID=UPI0025ABBFFC|nr:HMG1/2-like protein [Salvia miltiorrhiza]